MATNKIKIMLDAGHTAKDNKSHCKTTSVYYEGTFTWALQNKIAEKLKKYGFEVSTTRDNINADLPVYNRGLKAKGYDLFVSLHSNTCGGGKKIDESCDRPVIIVPLNHTTKFLELAEKIGNVVHETIGTKQKIKDKFYQIYTKRHPQLTDKDYYGVIRGAVAAGCKNALIIEHSFHSCTKTVEFLLKDSNIDFLAQKEVEVIAEFFGVKKEEPIRIGDIVHITGAKYYNSPKTIPTWVKEKNWIVRSIKNERIVIDKSEDGKHSICSAVNLKDVKKIHKS